MAQALVETIFDLLYLTAVLLIGITLLKQNGGNRLVKNFGLMAVLLGAGDAFHLVPRMYALWTTGVAANAAALGIGKLITSITMTIFYLLLYFIWRERYAIQGRKGLTIAMWALAAARIGLCLFPQNGWLQLHSPLNWAIYRNIPFAAMGILIILLFWERAGRGKDPIFRHMPLAVALSFGFYIPVVLWGDVHMLIGMLMIPKTLAYVWIVWMGWRLHKSTPRAIPAG